MQVVEGEGRVRGKFARDGARHTFTAVFIFVTMSAVLLSFAKMSLRGASQHSMAESVRGDSREGTAEMTVP